MIGEVGDPLGDDMISDFELFTDAAAAAAAKAAAAAAAGLFWCCRCKW